MAALLDKSNGRKPSFASIAAMAPPPTQNRRNDITRPGLGGKMNAKPSIQTIVKEPSEPQIALHLQSPIETAMSRLDIKETPSISSEISEHELGGSVKTGLKFDDEKTHLSSSSTKQTSLDGKSVASVTTFAMDEKESLRPDDSASVQAGEEDDSYSGPASGAPNSRVGSEAGGRAFRDQFHEISERIGPSVHRGVSFNRRGIPGIEEEGPPAPLVPPINASTNIPKTEANQNSTTSFSFNYQEPDEKLFEALESPKDRLFLLRLEQDVITFVRDSQDSIFDLPPCNSFCRLLAHKLADYYALTHFVDNAVSAVRLYRTPYCRLPTPLSVLAKSSNSSEIPSSTQPTMKIMRRSGVTKEGKLVDSGANTTASSIVPSKAASETGDDSQRGTGLVSPADSVTAKDKSTMTREEREAKYKETRERIFKGFVDLESAEVLAETDMPREVSRESSASGKKRSKKNRATDDGFEARSQFNAYYPGMQYQKQAYDSFVASTTFFNPYLPQHSDQVAQNGGLQNYNQPLQSVHSIAAQQMPIQHAAPTGAFSPYWPQGNSEMISYGQQMPPQFYQPMPHQYPIGQQSSTMSSPALSNNTQLSRQQSQISDQHWPQGTYQRPFQSYEYQTRLYQPQPQGNPISTNGLGVPYQYGQLPYQPNMQNGRPSHPLPGSYNRQSFNPQTRAFVPGNNMMPSQPGSYAVRSFNVGQGAMYTGSNGHSMQEPWIPQTQAPALPSYSSLPPVHGMRKPSNQPSQQQSSSPAQSSLSKWGTPANLPPKPPPPEVPTALNSISAQHMSNGQSMPTFQNGTYSKPSANPQ